MIKIANSQTVKPLTLDTTTKYSYTYVCNGPVLVVFTLRHRGHVGGQETISVHNRFGGMRDLAYFEGGIRDAS